MRPAIFGRRRVEQFAQHLDDLYATAEQPATTEQPDTREDAVVHALSMRADDFAPAPEPLFRQQLRATLIAAAERNRMDASAAIDEPTTVLPLGLVKVNGRKSRPFTTKNRRVRRTRAAVIVGLAVGTLAVSGISVASGSAGPGDPLYGVKRSGEDARVALAGSNKDRGALYLQFARNRMAEAAGTDSAQSLGDLFDAMDQDTQLATSLLTGAALGQHDATLLNPLSQFVADQQRDLAALARTGSAAKRLTTDSVDLIDQVNARITAVRAAIACHASYTDTGGALGPAVTACP